MKTNLKAATVLVMSVILFNTGCLQRRAVVKDTFLLDARRGNGSVQKPSGGTLAVQPFSIAAAFADKGIVSRTGNNQYESDFYSEYFISPAPMFTEQTRRWLSESGLFAQVLSPVSSVEATHLLEGHIQQVLMDNRDPAAPLAVLEIQFFLLQKQSRTRTIEFHKTYQSTQPMKSASFQDYIAVQNEGLRNILSELESDLASHR